MLQEKIYYNKHVQYDPTTKLPPNNVISYRPCLLESHLGNYPWLADSWPTSDFSRNGKDTVNCCAGKLDSTDQYYNSKNPVTFPHFHTVMNEISYNWVWFPASGLSNYQNQNSKYSPASNDGGIYCTINPSDADVHDLCSLYSQGPDPYTRTPVLSKTDLYSLEQDQWSLQSGRSEAEYAKLQYPREENGRSICGSIMVLIMKVKD